MPILWLGHGQAKLCNWTMLYSRKKRLAPFRLICIISSVMKFKDIQFNSHNGGFQGFVDLVNGYRLSVVQSPYSYGGNKGLWEIGLMAGNSLVKVSEWCDQVKGYLTESEVEKEIKWLNKKLLNEQSNSV